MSAPPGISASRAASFAPPTRTVPACSQARAQGRTPVVVLGRVVRPPYSADRRSAASRSSPDPRTAGFPAEVHDAVADIRGAGRQQTASQADDLVGVTAHPRFMLNVPHVQRRHVPVNLSAPGGN